MSTANGIQTGVVIGQGKNHPHFASRLYNKRTLRTGAHIKTLDKQYLSKRKLNFVKEYLKQLHKHIWLHLTHFLSSSCD